MDPKIVGKATVDGVPTTIVAFAACGKQGLAIWFRLWVDGRGLVRQAHMRAIGHFMDHRYFDLTAGESGSASTILEAVTLLAVWMLSERWGLMTQRDRARPPARADMGPGERDQGRSMDRRPQYKLFVINRFPPRVDDGEWQISANLSAGRGGHFVLCGTITMSQSEWDRFVDAMRTCLGEDFAVVDEG